MHHFQTVLLKNCPDQKNKINFQDLEHILLWPFGRVNKLLKKMRAIFSNTYQKDLLQLYIIADKITLLFIIFIFILFIKAIYFILSYNSILVN